MPKLTENCQQKQSIRNNIHFLLVIFILYGFVVKSMPQFTPSGNSSISIIKSCIMFAKTKVVNRWANASPGQRLFPVIKHKLHI